MTDDELIDAYHEAMGDYEAAKARRSPGFWWQRGFLSARLGRIDLDLERSGSAIHHWPDNRQAQ
jgi:hypothetical protein